MLFFGCRHPDQDFLYQDELEAASAAGELELHVAFSRHESTRVYVQDLVKHNQGSVWEQIQAGAVVYVCGDGVGMEPDVKRALMAIYVEQNDASFEEAQLWLESFMKDGRYVLDVWAGG